eukprot:4466777-Karenia_brevis.AAC.1
MIQIAMLTQLTSSPSQLHPPGHHAMSSLGRLSASLNFLDSAAQAARASSVAFSFPTFTYPQDV